MNMWHEYFTFDGTLIANPNQYKHTPYTIIERSLPVIK